MTAIEPQMASVTGDARYGSVGTRKVKESASTRLRASDARIDVHSRAPACRERRLFPWSCFGWDGGNCWHWHILGRVKLSSTQRAPLVMAAPSSSRTRDSQLSNSDSQKPSGRLEVVSRAIMAPFTHRKHDSTKILTDCECISPLTLRKRLSNDRTDTCALFLILKWLPSS